mmetsp:Transcript_75557/g.179521  ORF Transcript_75557/g.179521 Transcript_75557/m.179521 type:complete len:498 (+) Transcript_75557:125-1618(+)
MAELATRKAKLCRFHEQGACRYGDRCPFVHRPTEGDGPPRLRRQSSVEGVPEAQLEMLREMVSAALQKEKGSRQDARATEMSPMSSIGSNSPASLALRQFAEPKMESQASNGSVGSMGSMRSAASAGGGHPGTRRRRMSAPAVWPGQDSPAAFGDKRDNVLSPSAAGIGYCRECLGKLPPDATSPYCGPGRCLLGPASPRSPTANAEVRWASPQASPTMSPHVSPPQSPRTMAASAGATQTGAQKPGNLASRKPAMEALLTSVAGARKAWAASDDEFGMSSGDESPGSPLVLAPTAPSKDGRDSATAVLFRKPDSKAYQREDADAAPAEQEKHKRHRKRPRKHKAAAGTEAPDSPGDVPRQRRGSAPAVFDATASLTQWMEFRPRSREAPEQPQFESFSPTTNMSPAAGGMMPQGAPPPYFMVSMQPVPITAVPVMAGAPAVRQPGCFSPPAATPGPPGAAAGNFNMGPNSPDAKLDSQNKLMEGLLKAAMPESYED